MKRINFFSNFFVKMVNFKNSFIKGTKKFINTKIYYQYSNKFRILNNRYKIVKKLQQYLVVVMNVSLTGICIYIALSYKNFLSYGIFAALAQYYIGWLIDKIKETKELN